MKFRIEGQVRLYEEHYKSTTDIIRHLVEQQFQDADEHIEKYHVTLLYIGEYAKERVIPILKHSLFNHLFFIGTEPSLMSGGEEYDLILLKIKSPELVDTFRSIYAKFKDAGVVPEHTLYAGGYTPHVTLARYENKEVCEAVIDHDAGLFAQQLMNSGGPLVIGDFRLFGDDGTHDVEIKL